MDINWQNNNPYNPAEAAIGPQIYDNHLYYSCVLFFASQTYTSLLIHFRFRFGVDIHCTSMLWPFTDDILAGCCRRQRRCVYEIGLQYVLKTSMTRCCRWSLFHPDLHRIVEDAALGNSPLLFGGTQSLHLCDFGYAWSYLWLDFNFRMGIAYTVQCNRCLPEQVGWCAEGSVQPKCGVDGKSWSSPSMITGCWHVAVLELQDWTH